MKEIIVDVGQFTCDDGSVRAPVCCGQSMKKDGGCAEGCCDDYRCEICNKKVRVEWAE